MQFLNPAAFYLLGVIPIVVALHFLKLRRHIHRVPSIMLWLSTDEDRRANVPFQRLRNILLPLLQVLFLLLVTFSVARPALRRPGFMAGRAILIVDNTASMLSAKKGKTRLDLAKQAALKHIEQVSATGGMMLMVTSPSESDTYIREAFTTDTSKLQSAITNITPTHIPRDLRPVFDAAARYSESPEDKVFFISDNFENLPDIPLSIHKIGVGADAENVGIVHFSVERVADRYKVLVAVQNFTNTLREIDVQLAVENVQLDEKTAAIPPGKTKSILFSGDPSGLEQRVISAHLRLAEADDFTLDNSASAILPAVSPLRILLVSDNQDSLLPQLLKSYGNHTQLSTVTPSDYHGTNDADIAIFDGGTPSGQEAFGSFSEVASGTHLIFFNPGSNLPFIAAESRTIEIDTGIGSVIKTDETHPLMANVSLQKLQVHGSTHRRLPLSSQSLAETEKGALIWLGSEADSQFLVFEFDAFNPRISTFATSIDGPLFVYQCLAWLEARSTPLQPLTADTVQTRHAFQTGEQVKIAPISDGVTLSVQKPDKKRIRVADSIFTETDQVGVYTLFADDTQLEWFTVNLLDAKVSALPHSATAPVPEVPAATANGFQPMTQEVWRIPALFAFIVLLLEWWFYHRQGVSIRGGMLSKGPA